MKNHASIWEKRVNFFGDASAWYLLSIIMSYWLRSHIVVITKNTTHIIKSTFVLMYNSTPATNEVVDMPFLTTTQNPLFVA